MYSAGHMRSGNQMTADALDMRNRSQDGTGGGASTLRHAQ